METQPLKDVVFEVVRRHAPVPGRAFDADTPIGLGGLGIDSIGTLDVLLELERRTGITLRSDRLTAEALSTPGNLVRYLQELAGESIARPNP